MRKELTNKNTYYSYIDIVKFIFCFFIVAIHTHLFEEYPDFYWWANRLFFRLAVPYFMVVSVFLLERRIDSGKNRKEAIIAFSKRIGTMLLIFEPIALLLNIITWICQGMTASHIVLHCVQSVLFYPLGALWYLWAILLAVWLDYILEYVIRMDRKLVWVIALILYAIGLMGNSYYFVVDGTSIGNAFNLYLRVFESFRNVFHYGMLMVLIGNNVYAAYISKRFSKRTIMISCAVLYAIYVVELCFLRDKTFTDDGSMFVLLPAFTAFFVLTLTQHHIDVDKEKTFRNLSTGIYLIHRDILYILTLVLMAFGLGLHSISKFFIVGGVSMLICFASYHFNWKIAKYLM